MGHPPVSRLQIFSASVIRETASAALSSSATVMLQKGMVLCGEPITMHGLYSSDGHSEPGGLLNGAEHGFGGGGGGGGCGGVGTGFPLQVNENTCEGMHGRYEMETLPDRCTWWNG